MVYRIIKGIFHERPLQPWYLETWDVSRVTSYIESLVRVSLADHTHKTVMLLALTRPSRSAVRKIMYLLEGVRFHPTKLAKQSRQSRPVADFFFPAFTPDQLLCTMSTFRVYENRTVIQTRRWAEPSLLTAIKPHNPVSSLAIAQWLKGLLGKAGIDTPIFQGTLSARS